MKKSDTYGLISSILSCIILFLILFFYVIPLAAPPKEDDEGIMVSFGQTDDGSGSTETPTSAPVVTPQTAPPPAAPAVRVKPSTQDLMTQNNNSLAIAEKKQKEKERRELQAVENQRLAAERQAAEAFRKEQEAIQRAKDEKARREQEAIQKANAMNGAFGGSNSSGSGNTTGQTQQGNPVGRGSSGGNSWSLTGRSLSGRLVSPNYDRDVEGKITVNIRVDQSGRVVSATVGSPTNIADAATRNAAISAAKNTSFTSGKDVSTGSITYNFNLK